jgi:hypothetical protein
MSYAEFARIVKVILCIICTISFISCDSGLKEQKRFKTNILAGDMSAWMRSGAKDADLTAMQFTNKTGSARIFRYQTNIVVGGVSYETVLKFENEDFLRRGCLVTTRDGTVIWVGNDGKNEITYLPKR